MVQMTASGKKKKKCDPEFNRNVGSKKMPPHPNEIQVQK